MGKRNRDAQQQVFALVQAASDQGFRVEPPVDGKPKGQDRHYKVYGKDGQTIVVVASSPSSPSAPRNARARLRRMGVEL